MKAKNKLKKSKIFKISDLTYVKHGLLLDELLETKELLNPIEIKIDTHSSIMGAGGIYNHLFLEFSVKDGYYERKNLVVFKGSRRVTTALKLGCTYIEGVIID